MEIKLWTISRRYKVKILTVASNALAAWAGVKPIDIIVALASGSAVKSELLFAVPGIWKGEVKSRKKICVWQTCYLPRRLIEETFLSYLLGYIIGLTRCPD